MTQKLKDWLTWTGAALAIAGGVAYMAITLIFVFGIEQGLSADERLLYAIISAAAGTVIALSLMFQGIELSKKENKDDLEEYYSYFYKEKKKFTWFDSLNFFIIKKILSTILIKASGVAASTYMVIWIMINGNGELSLIASSIANLFLFTGFGLIGMSSAFTFHDSKHMKLIKEKTTRLKNIKTTTPPSVEEQGDKYGIHIQQEEVSESTGTSSSE